MAVDFKGLYVIRSEKQVKGQEAVIELTAADFSAGASALVMMTAEKTDETMSQWHVVRYFTKDDKPTPFKISLPTTWWQLVHLPDGVGATSAEANDLIGKVIGSGPGNPVPPPVHADDEPPPGAISGPGHI